MTGRDEDAAFEAGPPLSAYDDDAGPPASEAGSIAARAINARRVDYLDALNPEQRRAVETTEGPVLVLAGAGTGKTRVLTTRIAHLLATGKARPWEILAVTFTNKAAREMRHRIGNLIGGAVEGMQWLGTFHSIGVKLLRRHAELIGLKPDFTILDTDDQLRLMKQVIQAANVDEKRWPARALAGMIDNWKNRGWGPRDLPPGEGMAFANGRGADLYAAYQARLKILNAVDFGDLLLECLRLFREHPDVLKDYHLRFRYMLVDEYQDTNVAQYLWLRLLAQRPAGPNVSRANLCCVGDDDQSIYGWRGAEVDNILRFEKDFPGAAVIRLERNYRSTSPILGAASHLIAHNESRLGKTLFTDAVDPEAVPVKVASAWDSEEEARAIGDEIERLQRHGQNLNEVAILVRASFQMRSFEDRFVTLGLDYRVIGGPRFYERQEIRDALAYLRATAQPADDLAFERIVNTPRRGIGDATVRLLHDYARRQGIPMQQAANELIDTEEINARTRTALRDLLDQFGRWRGQLETMRHTELAELILEESGYTEMWQNDRSADAPGRLENLKELIRSMDDFETMGGFLEHISLVMDTERDGDAEAISIMTLHSAKGLEFETVFLPGWEEGVFPNQRALDEGGRASLEEERRLAYVGITRAKRRAYIWFAANRRIHGLWQSSIPSRFVDELPPDHIEIMEQGPSYGGYGVRGMGGYGASRFDKAEAFANTYETPGWQRAKARRDAENQGDMFGGGGYRRGREGIRPSTRAGGPMEIEGELVAKSSAQSPYGLGQRVFHQKFGYGHITSIDGNKLTIDFDKAGQKRVIDSFVEVH
ncbi:MAG: UvrD-helicase domain-containing protein [Bauldia sp.]|nr:UvrD-helicase domain-containing protein [Bauldia sp.]